MGGVVVVGSFNVDHVWTSERLPQPGETLTGRYASGPGGKDIFLLNPDEGAKPGMRVH